MCNLLKLIMCVAMLVLLTGCVADRNEKRLVRPMEKMAAIYDNGTIYKAGFNEHPLFEERRARNVGDGLIMNVAEQIKPAKKPEKKAAEDGSSADSEAERRRMRATNDDDLSNIESDALVGMITMTVMEVMEDGNLFVAGGKQVSNQDGDKYLRITGVVDPNNITNGNMVQSTQVADVRVQLDEVRIYSDRTATRMSEGQSVFGGLFQSMHSQ